MNSKLISEVSVVIPNYNNRYLLENLLISLENQITFSQVIIVDNNSQDDSVEFIRTNYPEIKLIVNQENKGFAVAVNQGISLVKTKFVFLLNNDTELDKNTIKELIKVLTSSDDIFSVSSKMIQLKNPDLIDDAGDGYTILGWSKRRGYGKKVENYSQDEEVFSACAGAALYKKSIFDEIGLFDENFESYLEDMDISFRSRLHGYKCYYASKAYVYHYGSASSGSRYNEFKVKLSARNNIYLIYKNMPLWMKIINFVFIFLGVLIKYIFFYKKGLHKYYIGGIREALSTKSKLKKSKTPLINSLKIEVMLIKNTLTFLK